VPKHAVETRVRPGVGTSGRRARQRGRRADPWRRRGYHCAPIARRFRARMTGRTHLAGHPLTSRDATRSMRRSQAYDNFSGTTRTPDQGIWRSFDMCGYVPPPDSAQNCAGADGGLVITANVPIPESGRDATVTAVRAGPRSVGMHGQGFSTPSSAMGRDAPSHRDPTAGRQAPASGRGVPSAGQRPGAERRPARSDPAGPATGD
jgi:hypothetical protein